MVGAALEAAAVVVVTGGGCGVGSFLVTGGRNT